MNHVESIVAENDQTAFDRILDELTAKDYSHLTLTRYEDDSLQIFTNPNSAWIMYLREPDDSGLYLNDPTRGDSEKTSVAIAVLTSISLPGKRQHTNRRKKSRVNISLQVVCPQMFSGKIRKAGL